MKLSFRMPELEWIGAASKAFTYCGHLLHTIRKLEQKFIKIQEEVARLKTLVERQKKSIDELTGKQEDGSYDTVY